MRVRCRRQCRDRVMLCTAAGERRRACTEQAMKQCLREGLALCPPLDRAKFAADIAAAMAEELTLSHGLCVATLPSVAVSSAEEAIGVGKEQAAALIQVAANDLVARVRCGEPPRCSIAAFAKLAVQGTSGAGAPLLPFARIVARAAQGQAVIYSRVGAVTPNAYAIVGAKDGLALGIVVTRFGGACAR